MSTTSNTQTYDKNSDNFAVSPSLTLGHLYQQYQEELYLRAVATPSDYAKVRSNVIQKVKMGIVNDLYKNLRSVLCKGEILSSGEKLISFSSGGSYSAASYCPNYPPLEADSIVLSIAKALDKELNDIVEIIIPAMHDVLKNRLEAKAT